ncbi:hypothetical protein [Melittangium boletus]|uniref:Uncharacterized protein n=1 Tax=Melittangium boletus DSM 14713 TaxID=1294270 RepID=A0A250IDT9_9BACT|nr:hypothetical protein [Melittangium boletus]ATB30009.1 hypothetical protein MEBOL_003464 [Melittangium boletus DSM 14713]
MGPRELKEEALHLYAQRRFAECARTYAKLLALEPGDPSLHVRQAEACRRAGERHQAMHAYRTAAELWMRLGNEARARAVLKVALELEPRNQEMARELTRLGPPAALAGPQELFEFPEDLEAPHAWSGSPPPPALPLPSSAELRRLSDNLLAIRAAPGTRWWVVSSRTPLLAYEVDDIERVAAPGEGALEVTLLTDS